MRLPILLHGVTEAINAHTLDQDFNPRFVFVVAAAIVVLYTRKIESKYDNKCTSGKNGLMTLPITGVRPKPPPTNTSKPISPASFLTKCKPISCGWLALTVGLGTNHRDFEFTRQIGKFWVKGRPLANNFAMRTWVSYFILNYARIRVGGGITDTVTRSLNRVHLYAGKLGQDIRHFLRKQPSLAAYWYAW